MNQFAFSDGALSLVMHTGPRGEPWKEAGPGALCDGVSPSGTPRTGPFLTFIFLIT